jgi:phosphate transport system substrate-binding protein
MRYAASSIKYSGSSPADGIKRLVNKEVDFSTIDMPLSRDDLKKYGLNQFPFVLGAVTPVVNLPNVYPGQFKLDGNTLGEIFLGHIKKWNDPAIVALNSNMHLPDQNIIIIHRFSPPGIRTIIGDFLAKTHPRWREIKGEGDMAGVWPESAIEVKNPQENLAMIKKTPFSIGYGPIQQVLKNELSYVKLKNKAGNFVSPSDESIGAAAENALWDEKNGFDVVLTDQPGANSWPMSNASFFLVRKGSSEYESTRDVLKYFRYNLRFGSVVAIQNNFTPLPDAVVPAISAVIKSKDENGVSTLKD